VEADGVHYKVSDFSNNTTEVVRPIVYSDPVAPEVTLLGKETTIVVQGNQYEEPGYTAVDNFDGDLTTQVTVSGQVDHRTLGEYSLTYTVTDSFGNTASAVRTVVVREYPELPDFMPLADPYTIEQPAGKVVYLTFDDGPSAYTEELLDVLAKYDVKATFFVVDRGQPETLRRIVADGHTLAMHAGSHNYYKIYSSEEAYFKDLKQIQDVILKETGQLSTIVRFPGGTGNTVSRGVNTGIMTRLSKMLHAMNYRYFDWNVNSGDAEGIYDSEVIYNNVIGGIMGHDVSIVLQHDINYSSVLAVEDIIKWGLKNGYTFQSLDSGSPACEVKPRN
jgi:peptidoglycan/xylan/chitin deacetylase (PgdA/CDA1 family)